MKSSTINLDLTGVEAESGSIFSKVPAGAYKVVLAYSQFKDGKNSGAAGLQVGYMIEEGAHKGKMVQDYINIMNENEEAVEIGKKRLRKICEVQGRKTFKLAKDTDLIAKGAFMIDVDIEASTYKDKPTENNRVKKIYEIDGATTAKAEASSVKKVQDEAKSSPTETTSDEEAAPGKLPWE